MYMKTILFLLFLVLASSRLDVYMPTCATKKFESNINYTLANFGHILYGRTLVGQLFTFDNEEMCDTEGVDTIAASNDDVFPFFLIKRGTCKFTKKILNAQQKGAKLAIIYDNGTSTQPHIIMANDGHGHLIDIPGIFVSHDDGIKLKQTLEECKGQLLKINFQVYTSKIANVTLWLNSNNRQSYVMIRDFYRDYYPVIRKYMKLDLRFRVNSRCSHNRCEDSDCVSNKRKYCLATQKDISGQHLPGKQILTEHLRSYFLFQQTKSNNNDIWWNYMNKFDQNLCAQVLDVKACSEKTMKSLNYDYTQINKKIEETYDNISNSQHNILQTFVDDQYHHDIFFYPEATINGRNFYGLFRAPDIFEMICQSLESAPSECYSFQRNDRKTTYGEDQSKGIWKTILFVLSMFAIAFFIALCVYTRLIKQEINQQMSVEVNRMVEHYVQLQSQKSKSNAQL